MRASEFVFLCLAVKQEQEGRCLDAQIRMNKEKKEVSDEENQKKKKKKRERLLSVSHCRSGWLRIERGYGKGCRGGV